MKKLLFLFVIIACALLETTVLNSFRVFNTKPDLLLTLVVIVSLGFELRWAIFFSIFAGLLKDSFSISSFGINTILFGLWSFILVRLSRKISVETDLMRVIVLSIVLVLNSVVLKIIFFYSGKFIPFGIFMRTAFFSSAYTILVSPLLFRYIRPQDYIRRKND